MSTNPGSSEAKRLGCTCPVLDNAYGQGAVVDGKVVPDQWYTDPDCPIHRDRRLVDDGPVGRGETAGDRDAQLSPVTGDNLPASAEAQSGANAEREGAGVDQLQEDDGRRAQVSGDRAETSS